MIISLKALNLKSVTMKSITRFSVIVVKLLNTLNLELKQEISKEAIRNCEKKKLLTVMKNSSNY